MSKFVWFEYCTNDAKKAQGFLGELFNWNTKEIPMPDGPYTMIALGERTIGGYSPLEGAPAANWLAHLEVTDAKASSAKVKSLGGKVLMEPFKVGDFGTVAVVADPQGGTFALWQSTGKTEEEAAPANGAFCWNELSSSDPAKSVAFYKALGGFEVEAKDMGPDMGTYHVLTSGGVPRAGIMKHQMPGQPHAWLPYVKVAKADATAEKAKKLGANVVVPPTDIPGIGRFAILVDAQGVATGILQD